MMSYDSDYESMYMVEFESGRTIYVNHFTVQDVIEHCNEGHKDQTIKMIYKEVYSNAEEDDDE
jgi:hypothetical protein